MRFLQVLIAATFAQLVSVSSAKAHLECGRSPFENNPSLSELFASLSAAVSQFPGLLNTLQNDLRFCLSDTLVSTRGYYEPEDRTVVLAKGMTPGLALAVAVHELRHIQQYDFGSCPGLSLSMREYANGVFAMEADASVTSLVVAASLREQGDPAMWEALANWPMQSDLAARYEAVFAETSNIGRAASAAFSAWYENKERLDSYYVAICSDYLEQMDRKHLLPRYDSLSEDYFTNLCRLPNGSVYECRSPY